MSYGLAHLNTVQAVDQAIMNEMERVVCIRFGADNDPQCTELDGTLFQVADRFVDKVSFYLVDCRTVRQYNKTFQWDGDCNLVFFYQNNIVKFDYGEGTTNRINFAISNPDVLSDIIETIYEGVRRGKEHIVTRNDYSPENNYLSRLYPSNTAWPNANMNK